MLGCEEKKNREKKMRGKKIRINEYFFILFDRVENWRKENDFFVCLFG